MLISHKHKFIFIHIYKTGGTSISQALMPYCASKFDIYTHRILSIFRIYSFNPSPYSKHISVENLIPLIGNDIFENYFTFSIVRNPWDWQVSLYNYMLAHPEHSEHQKIKSLNNFTNYIEWRYQSGIKNQIELLTYNNRLNIDFIGRFESLETDFHKICAHLKINEQLPHKNFLPKKPYVEYYTPQTREMIGSLCKQDIDAFGYTFDG